MTDYERLKRLAAEVARATSLTTNVSEAIHYGGQLDGGVFYYAQAWNGGTCLWSGQWESAGMAYQLFGDWADLWIVTAAAQVAMAVDGLRAVSLAGCPDGAELPRRGSP